MTIPMIMPMIMPMPIPMLMPMPMPTNRNQTKQTIMWNTQDLEMSVP